MWLALTINFATAFWVHLVCERKKCIFKGYQQSNMLEPPIIIVNGDINIVLIGLLNIVNTFAGAGFQHINPMNSLQATLMSILSLWLQVMLVILASSMASFMTIRVYSKGIYEYNLANLLQYLEDREISNVLLRKVKKYCIQMWKRQGGYWIPEIITLAPRYIQQDLMHDLYGHHLLNSDLFCTTHMHFLQQLVTRLERCMYFPGDYIVKEGEVNHCMYFIHTGDVCVIDQIDEDDKVIETLSKNDAFGLVQGLHALPHAKTYKARSVADLLFLKREKWIDLLQAFPASREEVFTRSVQLGLDYYPQSRYKKISVSHED